jgi:DNA transformation protein
MFGGHGIYCRDLMIGLVDDDELFLKTDGETRERFVAAGCRQWVYTGGGRTMETSYFRPPDEAHDSPEDMLPWGELALVAARRAAAARRTRVRREGTPKGAAKGVTKGSARAASRAPARSRAGTRPARPKAKRR